MRSVLTLLICDARYRKLEFRAAFVLYLALLVFGSIPGARAEIGKLASGLVLHLLAYGVITILLFSGANGSAGRKAVKSLLIIVAMGAIDEWVQSYLPYRSANIMDWFVDINAGFFASALLWIIWPRKSGRRAE